MNAESFEKILRLIWADASGVIRWWDASAALGPGPRTLQRWASGKNEIPEWMLGRVNEAIKDRQAALDEARAVIADIIREEFRRQGIA